jgi:hypothetical protein
MTTPATLSPAEEAIYLRVFLEKDKAAGVLLTEYSRLRKLNSKRSQITADAIWSGYWEIKKTVERNAVSLTKDGLLPFAHKATTYFQRAPI